MTVSTGGDAAEATGLAVQSDQRGRGYGAELLAAAARTAEAAGSSRLALGSQDSGSGHLDGWYRSLGFKETGVVDDRYIRFEAPTSILRGSTVRRSVLARRPGAAIGRERPRIRRMEARYLWYELLDDGRVVGHDYKKPGGYKLVRDRKAPDGSSVFETKEKKSAKAAVTKKEKEEAEEKAQKELDVDKAKLLAALPSSDSDRVFELYASQVRYSQDSIDPVFQGSGGSIHESAQSIIDGETTYRKFPAIRIFTSAGGHLITLDNRRLWCCNKAKTKVRCVWAEADEIKKEGAWKLTAGDEGWPSIVVRPPKK